MYYKLQDSEGDVKKISFGSNSERLKQDYIDIFEGVKSDVMYTAKYDKNSDTGTTYIGTSEMRRQVALKTQHKASIMEDYYIHGKLLDGTDCKILLEMEASKSFMYKTFYLNCPSLHSLLKFISMPKDILVGIDQFVSLLFAIPVVTNKHGHRFEAYTRLMIMWIW